MTAQVATMSLSALALAVIAIAIYTDVRWGLILNRWTLPAVAIGLLINGAGHGVAGLTQSGEGVLIGCALFGMAVLFRPLFGSGDVKLLVAVGACLGPSFLMWNLFYMAFAGAVLAAVVQLYYAAVRPRALSLSTGYWAGEGSGAPVEIGLGFQGLRIPYAVAIGAGTLLTMLVMHG
jgi:prepilin signal peptidase PulO-like enzyme (type II secretory pathway)